MTDSDTPIHLRDEPYAWMRAGHGATIAHLIPQSMSGSANPPALCRRRIRAPKPRDGQEFCPICEQHRPDVRMQ